MSTNITDSNSNIRIMATRHSAFYSPLLLAVKSSFLSESAVECTYSVAEDGQDVNKLLLEDKIDIAQSTISSMWNKYFDSEIINFAQINRMDGFYLLRRNNISKYKEFNWPELLNKSVLVDQAVQPLMTFKYALFKKDVPIKEVDLISCGSPENMINEFVKGKGDYIHLQGPDIYQLVSEGHGDIVTSIGKNIGPLSFSTLICKKSFILTPEYSHFLKLFLQSKIFSANENIIKVAEVLLDFFPDTELEVLVDTISQYRDLKCWDTNLNITENHYDNTLQIFQHFGLEGIYPYSEAVNNKSSSF